MAEGVVQLPPDSTGKQMRTQTGGASMPASTHQPVETLADAAGNLLTSQGSDTKRALDVNFASSAGGMNAVSGTLTAAGTSVSASIGSSGNGTIVLYGGTYTVLTLVFEASYDNTNWFPIDVVRSDGTAVVTTESFTAATATNTARAWNYMAPGYQYVRVRASAFTATVNPTVVVTQGPFLYDPSPSVSPIDGVRLTYSASINSTSVAAATTTSVPVWEFVNPTGSGKLVRITRIAWELTLATAGTVPLQVMQKRTAASTGGTAVAQTAVVHDTTNAAASATVKYYTAAPTLAGSLQGVVRSIRVFGVATTMTTSPTLVEWLFGTRPGQSLVLRPGESINLQSIAAYGTAPTITGSIEWTEEPSAG